MSAPSLDGVFIFGAACKMQTVNVPRARQQNAYPGLSGVENLDQGGRGRTTTCTGIHYGGLGNDVSALASVQENFRSFDDGNTHALTDTRGITWINVLLNSYQPEGKIYFHSQLGFCQAYSAQFIHLT